MGMSVGGGKGRARGGRHSRQPMNEINVTPFVDVMLVLLIIFMVAAPLMNNGVEVNLPKTVAGELPGDNANPINISIAADGRISVSETETDLNNLIATVKALKDANTDTRILVRGDENVNYGLVMQVVSILQEAGFTKLGMPTRPIVSNSE